MKLEDSPSPTIVDPPLEKNPHASDVRSYVLNGKIYQAQLFLGIPDANADATKGYQPIEECVYTTKHIGDSGQVEIMTCDCKSEWDGTINHACGEDSDCINRLTSIECRNDHSSCGKNCQNQRFQKRQYAHIDVIKTEKKGFGLRALEDISAGSFIIEYVGEVIDDRHWRKRMETYEKEGIKHFFFMMLQKGQLIDATRKASFSRFANHSCRPNCAVEKWVVKDKLRMGIFSSRDIYKGEEITFDYNVDRFGADAQPCYCGESNCIGFLGGKTQTEAANKLPQLLVDALGLDEDDEDNWITTGAAKKRRGKKGANAEMLEIDEEYAANLPVKPIEQDHVSKVMSSLLQSQEQWLITKLIERIHITNDKAVDLQVLRMHGYQIFSTLLKQWSNDEQIVTCILEILSRWPKVTKNKISSSQIEVTVTEVSKSKEFLLAAELAKSVLKEWSALKMAYRIPRRERVVVTPTSSTPEVKTEDEATSVPVVVSPEKQDIPTEPKSKSLEAQLLLKKKKDAKNNVRDSKDRKLPSGWNSAVAPSGQTYYYNSDRSMTTWEWPGDDSKIALEQEKLLVARELLERNELQTSLQKIIDEASRAGAASTTPGTNDATPIDKGTPTKVRISSEEKKPKIKKHHSSSGSSSSAKKEQTVEKILTKTLAKYVPNQIAKYEEELGHQNIKNMARDIVQILVSKELRQGHEVKQPSELTDSRKAKVKKFTRDYMEKVLAKYRAKRAAKSAIAKTTSNPTVGEEPPAKRAKTNGHRQADIDFGDDDEE